eukprot:1622049-Pyramimonas_sp.AAC.1
MREKLRVDGGSRGREEGKWRKGEDGGGTPGKDAAGAQREGARVGKKGQTMVAFSALCPAAPPRSRAPSAASGAGAGIL